MIIKHLETKDQYIRNISLNALSVKAFLNGGTSVGSQSIDFSKVSLKVMLNRNGQSHVIMQDNLKVIGLASTVDKLTQSVFATTIDPVTTIASGNTGMLAFVIPFGGHINLKGDDEIYVEVYSGPGTYTDPALEASSSLEIKPMKSVGYEKFIPRFQSYVVQANETSNQYMIGDNVIRLVLLNYDKTDFQQNVIQQLAFDSDRLSESYTFPDLITRKLNRFGIQPLNPNITDEATQLQEDQSFVLTDFHEQFNQVQLDIQFNGANVSQSNNFICAWTYSTDWTILQRAANLEQKHQAENIAAIDKNSTKK